MADMGTIIFLGPEYDGEEVKYLYDDGSEETKVVYLCPVAECQESVRSHKTSGCSKRKYAKDHLRRRHFLMSCSFCDCFFEFQEQLLQHFLLYPDHDPEFPPKLSKNKNNVNGYHPFDNSKKLRPDDFYIVQIRQITSPSIKLSPTGSVTRSPLYKAIRERTETN